MAPRARVPRLPFTPHLLRLKPEIRERIYHYIFSDMVIEIGSRFDSAPSTETPQDLDAMSPPINPAQPLLTSRKITYYLTARSDSPDSRSKDLHDWAGLILSCRALHAETKLLVFELSTAHLGVGHVPRLLRCLQAPQKAALRTSRFESRALKDRGNRDFDRLHAFKGLRRVVVRNNRKVYNMNGLEKMAWVVKMRGRAKNEKLEAVFGQGE